jgi:hypothetical protein
MSLPLLAGSLSPLLALALGLGGGGPGHPMHDQPVAVTARLTEWRIELSRRAIAAGPVTFTVTNAGTIPHALEVEGAGIEREIPILQPGETGTLMLTLEPGYYEVYCPVGEDSHKKLGMETRLRVLGTGEKDQMPGNDHTSMDEPERQAMADSSAVRPKVRALEVTGGGTVIQILPGSFPFPDSAGPILRAFGGEQEALESQAQNGPYSNNVAPIHGDFTITAWDKGPVRDSVAGVARFTTRDGARWRVVIDRVNANDVPHHPKFGGVIFGLYYHGNTGVHTPLVPTINSAVALWAVAHLYRNDALVSDQAQVHVMLLSRTRRDGDFALACWDCSHNPIEELQLQITPAPGTPKFDAPGGFLFINWERSRSRKPAG